MIVGLFKLILCHYKNLSKRELRMPPCTRVWAFSRRGEKKTQLLVAGKGLTVKIDGDQIAVKLAHPGRVQWHRWCGNTFNRSIGKKFTHDIGGCLVFDKLSCSRPYPSLVRT